MAHSAEYQAGDGIVLLRLFGDLNAEAARSAIQDWLRVASEHNCKRTLMDYTRCRVTESTIGMFDLATKLNDIGVPRTMVIAALIESDVNDHTFVETVAQNRGWTYRVFTDARQALEWLRTA